MRFLTTAPTHDPFAHLGRLRREMDRLFECAAPTVRDTWAPPLTLHETESAFEVRLPVPGAEPESLDIQLERNVLSISGERAGVPDDATRRFAGERPTGKLRRSLELPTAVDPSGVEAHLRDGVLIVKLQKAAEALPRRITVQP
jgi:HSP20 family protein